MDLGPAFLGLEVGWFSCQPSREKIKARVPAGCVPRGLPDLVEGDGESQDGSVPVRFEVESQGVLVPRVLQARVRLACDDLASQDRRFVDLEDVSGLLRIAEGELKLGSGFPTLR